MFDAFLARDPNHVPALQFKMLAELRAERKSEALKTGERILKIDPSPQNKSLVADLYR